MILTQGKGVSKGAVKGPDVFDGKMGEIELIKLFACDLDGTLLNKNHMSDDMIRSTLKKIVSQGKFFTAATGRDCSMDELRYLGMTERGMYNITMNGALVRDWNGNILYSQAIDRQIVKDCLEMCPEPMIYYSGPFYTCVRAAKEEEETHRREMPGLTPAQEEERCAFEALMQAHNHYGATGEDVLRDPILKISCRVKNEALAAKMEAFLEQYDGRIFNAPYDDRGYEITKVHTHKGNSVKWLAEKLGLAMDEVAVYGDSWNDLEMLAMFSHSYTTTEAIPQVKDVVRGVLGSCADHSVAVHILKTLQEEQKT